jgi:hypothetical protein
VRKPSLPHGYASAPSITKNQNDNGLPANYDAMLLHKEIPEIALQTKFTPDNNQCQVNL